MTSPKELRAYRTTMSLIEFYQKYAPSADNNNPFGYASAVASDIGIEFDTKLDIFNDKILIMSYYSQHTPGYDKIKLGTCPDTLWQSACFLTSFCNLGRELEWFDYSPVSMNKLFISEKLWSGGCLLVCPTVAKHFGLTYEKLVKDPGTICIAETNKYAPKVPQHFFLYENGMIIDPLDPKPEWKKNTYPIVSYRVFKKIKTVTPEPKPAESVTPVTPPVSIPVEVIPPSHQTSPEDTSVQVDVNVLPPKENTSTNDVGDSSVETPPQKASWASFWQAILNFINSLRS